MEENPQSPSEDATVMTNDEVIDAGINIDEAPIIDVEVVESPTSPENGVVDAAA